MYLKIIKTVDSNPQLVIRYIEKPLEASFSWTGICRMKTKSTKIRGKDTKSIGFVRERISSRLNYQLLAENIEKLTLIILSMPIGAISIMII